MDRYKIIKRIGDGSQSETFLVHEANNPNSKFVLKKMPPGSLSNSERSIMLRMRHSNIIPCYDSFEHEESIFLVLMYAEGGDVEDYLAAKQSSQQAGGMPPRPSSKPASSSNSLSLNNRVLSFEVIGSWLVQCAEALCYCHENRIIHRDMKLANIFLSADYQRVYLGDFGVAKVLDKKVAVATTFVGSPVCLSPEVMSGTPYSYMSDVWALGCVLYELCSGKKPFPSENFAQLVNKVCTGQYDPLPTDLPPIFEEAIRGMLSIDVNERWQLADVLAGFDQFTPTNFKKSKKQQEKKGGVAGNSSGAKEVRASADGLLPRDRRFSASEDGAGVHPLTDLQTWLKAKDREFRQLDHYLSKFRENDEVGLMQSQYHWLGTPQKKDLLGGRNFEEAVARIEDPSVESAQHHTPPRKKVSNLQAQNFQPKTPEMNANRVRRMLPSPAKVPQLAAIGHSMDSPRRPKTPPSAKKVVKPGHRRSVSGGADQHSQAVQEEKGKQPQNHQPGVNSPSEQLANERAEKRQHDLEELRNKMKEGRKSNQLGGKQQEVVVKVEAKQPPVTSGRKHSNVPQPTTSSAPPGANQGKPTQAVPKVPPLVSGKQPQAKAAAKPGHHAQKASAPDAQPKASPSIGVPPLLDQPHRNVNHSPSGKGGSTKGSEDLRAMIKEQRKSQQQARKSHQPNQGGGMGTEGEVSVEIHLPANLMKLPQNQVT